jgi:hypothetical protein
VRALFEATGIVAETALPDPAAPPVPFAPVPAVPPTPPAAPAAVTVTEVTPAGTKKVNVPGLVKLWADACCVRTGATTTPVVATSAAAATTRHRRCCRSLVRRVPHPPGAAALFGRIGRTRLGLLASYTWPNDEPSADDLVTFTTRLEPRCATVKPRCATSKVMAMLHAEVLVPNPRNVRDQGSKP